MGLLSEVFRDPANLDKLTGMAAIGHVRYATAGEASVDNIQPFMFKIAPFFSNSCLSDSALVKFPL